MVDNNELYSKLRKKVEPRGIYVRDVVPYTSIGLGGGIAIKLGTNKLSGGIRYLDAQLKRVDIKSRATDLELRVENEIRKSLGYGVREIPQTTSSITVLDNFADKVDTFGTYSLGVTTLLGLAIGSVIAAKKIKNSKITRTLVSEIDRLKERYTALEEKLKGLGKE